jgi:Polysaccharide deacetylase
MKPPTSLFLVGLSVAVVACGAVTNPDPMESSIAHRRLANASLTASPAISQDHVIASWSVCGDGHCDQTYQGFGETCGNCPVDCGPCQRADDADECVEPLQYVLAFNDGPSAVTSSLLDVLDVYNVKANFFAIGERLNGHGSDFKQQRQRGHRQFGHSFNHSSSLTLSLQELYDDLSMTTNAFQRHGCYRPMLYRPPYGLQGAPQRKLATKLGMRAALWNLDTLDWLYAATNPGKLIVELRVANWKRRPLEISVGTLWWSPLVSNGKWQGKCV